MIRRSFLKQCGAIGGGLACSTLAGMPGSPAAQRPTGHTTLKAGHLTAVVGDNSSDGQHGSGYNGVWSVQHSAGKRSLFVPDYAGMNLEHIITGEHLEDGKTFFEPRHAAMSLKPISDSEAELYQPPTPTFQVESWTRFQLVAPHYLDMSFRCVAHKAVFPRGYLALFWASYINAPSDKSIYFLGGKDDQKDLWTQFCTQWHNDQSTVRYRNDDFEMTFPEGGRETLFKSLSRLRFDQPFFYGNFDDLIWLVMFDRTAGIRFAHSPSGGGDNPALQTTNPAWDFQFLIQKPEVKKEYGFRIRTVLRPRCSRNELLEEFKNWK